MSKNRNSGDSLEYMLAKYLHDNNNIKYHNTYTQNKYVKLKKNITLSNDINTSVFDKIFKEYFMIDWDDVLSFELMSDTEGKKGIASDIIIYTTTKSINISCKKNNISIKHQRPSGLPLQLKMSDEIKTKFKNEYAACNSKWFDKIKDKLTFDKMDNGDKLQLYNDFNIIVKKYLDNCSSEEIKHFYNFILSTNNGYILQLDTKKNIIILYDYITSIKSLSKIDSIGIEKQCINIKFDNNININLRLHTASKRITKSLSLKYDSKIVNIDDLYVKQIFKIE